MFIHNSYEYKNNQISITTQDYHEYVIEVPKSATVKKEETKNDEDRYYITITLNSKSIFFYVAKSLYLKTVKNDSKNSIQFSNNTDLNVEFISKLLNNTDKFPKKIEELIANKNNTAQNFIKYVNEELTINEKQKSYEPGKFHQEGNKLIFEFYNDSAERGYDICVPNEYNISISKDQTTATISYDGKSITFEYSSVSPNIFKLIPDSSDANTYIELKKKLKNFTIKHLKHGIIIS